ncbi:unnamed protein product [Sphagnum tenellum]
MAASEMQTQAVKQVNLQSSDASDNVLQFRESGSLSICLARVAIYALTRQSVVKRGSERRDENFPAPPAPSAE